MPRRAIEDSDWDQPGDNWEPDGDDPDFTPDDDEAEVVPCPYCKREIPEDTPRCPYCENYISGEDTPTARKPWWIIIGAAACLFVVYRWIVG